MKKKRFTNQFSNINNHFINSLYTDSNNKKIVLNQQYATKSSRKRTNARENCLLNI